MRALILIITFLFAAAAHAQIASPIPEPQPGIPLAAHEGTEDLTSLSVASSGLIAEPPISGEVVHTPDYTRELIRVQWRGGDPIDLYVILPKNVPHPPVVLYLYGYPSETDRFRNDDYCRSVTRGGFAAVGFVSSLTGQRYHDVPMKQWFVSELASALPITVHDVQMVLNYLGSRGDVDISRVGIFGQGSGGTIAILSAAADPRIQATDVIDPWGDWPDWSRNSPQVPEDERTRYFTPEFLKSVAPFDPLLYLPKLCAARFRIQQNLFNQAIPENVRIRLANAVPSATLVTYFSVDDYSKRAAQNSVILNWMHDQLTRSAERCTRSQ